MVTLLPRRASAIFGRFSVSRKRGRNCATERTRKQSQSQLIHKNSVSKWNFVVMDERSMTTFIFRVVQPLRFTSLVPLACARGGLCSRRCALASRADRAKSSWNVGQVCEPVFPGWKTGSCTRRIFHERREIIIQDCSAHNCNCIDVNEDLRFFLKFVNRCYFFK